MARFCDLLRQVYGDFGFPDFQVGFSTRPALRAGDDATWDRAEAALEAAAKRAGLAYHLKPGEGAFYGPKLEFVLTDSRGRAWQCGTIQLDFVLPERLKADYAEADGSRHRPVLLHHAVLGSLERFIAVLLEHYQGRLPFWLAPEQVAIASITEAAAAYASEVAARFRAAGIRAVADIRGERLARKIVAAREAGIPAFIAVGNREAAGGTLSLRQPDGSAVALEFPAALAHLQERAGPDRVRR